MKRQMLLWILLKCCITTSAQPVKLHTEADGRNGYRLIAEKTGLASYTVEVTFSSLMGYRLSEPNTFRKVITSYSEQIATLTRETANNYEFRYSYKTFNGKNISKADTNFVYLLPALPGKSIDISNTYYIGNIVGKDKPDFHATGFRYHAGDTICAARGGIVTLATSKAEARQSSELYNVKTRDNIYIEHADGTIGRYEELSPIKLLVQEGDKVIPGQPLAVFTTESDHYTMLFNVHYLNLDYTDENGGHYRNVPTLFYLYEKHIDRATVRQTYQVLHPLDIVTKELSSREIKKLGLKAK